MAAVLPSRSCCRPNCAAETALRASSVLVHKSVSEKLHEAIVSSLPTTSECDSDAFPLPCFVRMQACEAFRRAKFKFPGRQKIITSRNWCVAA